MSTLISIDPGANLGLAVFREETLFAAGFFKVKNLRELTKWLVESAGEIQPTKAVIEKPQIYDPRKWKGDPNDILNLAVIVGVCVAGLAPYCETRFVTPHMWKGSRPKALDNDYTYSLLSLEEKTVFDGNKCPKSQRNNVLDAIGLGLWTLKRR